MKAYKVTLLIVDPEVDGETIPSIIENTNYSNDCIRPVVWSMEETDITVVEGEKPVISVKEQKFKPVPIHYDGIFSPLVEAVIR